MWLLELPNEITSQGGADDVLTQTTTEKFCLIAGEFIVGRKDTEILISGNKTISRKHAKITVSPLASEELNAVGAAQVIKIEDLDSKFKTYVNDEELPKFETRELFPGDVIQFGMKAKLRLTPLPLVLCLSRVSKIGKEALSRVAAQVGAHVVDKWGPTCTHLVVEKMVTATVKIAFAVVHHRPVVDVSWLNAIWTRASLADPLPDPANYKPDWSQLAMAKKLQQGRLGFFQDICFIFLEKDDTEDLVQDAGGKVVKKYQWDEEGIVNLDLRALNGPEGRICVLVDPEKEETDGLVKRLRNKGLPLVIRHRIAVALFSYSRLRTKDHQVIGTGGGAAAAGIGGLSAATQSSQAAFAPPIPDPNLILQQQRIGTQETETVRPPARRENAANDCPAAPRTTTAASVDGAASLSLPSAAAAAAAATEEEMEVVVATEEKEGATAASSSTAKQQTTPKGWKKGAGSDSSKKGAVAATAVEEREVEGEEKKEKPEAPISSSPHRRRTRNSPAQDTATKKRGRAVATDDEAEHDEDGTSKAKKSRGATAAAAAMADPEDDWVNYDDDGGGGGVDRMMEVEEEESEGEKQPTKTTKKKTVASSSATKKQQQQQSQQEEEEEPITTLVGRSTCGGGSSSKATPSASKSATSEGGGEGNGAGPHPPTPPPSTVLATASSSSQRPPVAAASKQPFRLLQPRKILPPSDPKDGWLSKPPPAAKPISQTADGDEEDDDENGGGGRRRRRFKGEGGDDEEEEEELLDGETLVEERDLLVEPEVYMALAESPENRISSNGGAANGTGNKVDFKRFRKNKVLKCRRGETVGRADLIPVLPKESLMEIQLRDEEQLEYARHEEAERLFDDDDPGPKRRRKR